MSPLNNLDEPGTPVAGESSTPTSEAPSQSPSTQSAVQSGIHSRHLPDADLLSLMRSMQETLCAINLQLASRPIDSTPDPVPIVDLVNSSSNMAQTTPPPEANDQSHPGEITISIPRSSVSPNSIPIGQSDVFKEPPANSSVSSNSIGSSEPHSANTPETTLPWHIHVRASKYARNSRPIPFSRERYREWLAAPSSVSSCTIGHLLFHAENSALEHGLPISAAIYWIREACINDPLLHSWIAEYRDRVSSWEEFKCAFLKECHAGLHPHDLQKTLRGMRLRSNELPKELYLRFKHLVFAATDFCSSQEINLAIEQSLPLQCRLILAQHASSDLVGLARLNFFVEHHRTWALPMYPADGDSWPKDEDARFESFEPAPRSHFGNGQKRQSPSNQKSITTSSSVDGSLFCTFCRASGHLITSCPRPNCKASKFYQPSPRNPSSSDTTHANKTLGNAQSPVSPPAPNPQDSVPKKNRFISKSKPETTEDVSPCDLSYEDYTLSVLLEGTPITALLDTGAEMSVLSPDAVPQGIELLPPVSGAVSADGTSLNVLGYTPALKVALGDRELTHSFMVLPIQGYQMFVGKDLSRRFSLYVGSPHLQLHTWDSSFFLSEIPEDSSTISLEVPLPDSDRESILNFLQPVLQRNAMTSGEFCNLPEALVTLNLVPDAVPVYSRQYRLPLAHRDAIRTKLQSWLESGIMTLAPPGVQWNTPLLAVPKANGTLRICHDFRALNNAIKDDQFPMPQPREVLEQLAGSVIFSCLDLKESFNQLPLSPESRSLTAFTIDDMQYVCVGAPFGLKTLTSIFQRLMRRIFHGVTNVVTFVDDLIVYSDDVQEHPLHLKAVIDLLTNASLTLNADKCQFGFTSICALGRMVSQKGISINPSKLTDLPELSFPESETAMRSFLGLANYFREHLPHLANLEAPLNSLRNNVMSGDPTEQQLAAFLGIKNALISAAFLQYPAPDRPFSIWTDASAVGLGAILTQEDEHGISHPILFASRTLSKSERNYSATKRELLGIIFALQKFDYYVAGQRFILYTDHRALTFFHSQRDLSPLLWGWVERLCSYQMEIRFCPGKDNVIADAISRLYDHVPRIASITSSTSSPIAEISSSMDAHYILIQQVHELGHHGLHHVISTLRNWGHDWPNMAKEIREYLSQCPTCLAVNPMKSVPHGIWDSVEVDAPMDRICIDLLKMSEDISGAKYILVVVDVATRFLLLRPLPDKKAESVAAALALIVADFGPPRTIQSDRGLEFTAEVTENLMQRLSINQHLCTPYHPQSNGLAERFVRKTLAQLRKLTVPNDQWSALLPAAQLSLNLLVNSGMSISPFEALFARSCAIWDDSTERQSQIPSNEDLQQWVDQRTSSLLPDHLRERATQNEKIRTSNPPPLTIPNDTQVMLKNQTRSSKTEPFFTGPYVVHCRKSNGMYKIKDPQGHIMKRLVHQTHLKICN